MKICLIYTGYLRTWEQCSPNHDANIITGECSLFFYTYEHPKTEHLKRSIQRFQFIQIPEPFYPDPFGEHKFNTRKRPENTAFQTLNQWHNNLVGFCLVPKGFDVYVRIRPDIKFNGPLNFHDFDCSGNTIYIPQGLDFGGICDQFAFGNYEVMKKYYSVYMNVHQLWEDGAEFHSEGMQLANLQKQGVNIVRFGSPQHDIIR